MKQKIHECNRYGSSKLASNSVCYCMLHILLQSFKDCDYIDLSLLLARLQKEQKWTSSSKMVSLKECIDDKYGEKETESDDFGYIVFVLAHQKQRGDCFLLWWLLMIIILNALVTSVISQARLET